jgi:hypothetical protein
VGKVLHLKKLSKGKKDPQVTFLSLVIRHRLKQLGLEQKDLAADVP